MKLSRSSSPELDPSAFGVDFAPLPEYKAAADTALDFGGLLETPLKVHEDLTSGCGGQTWPAGVVLARHMLRYHREELRDARILEIGAGGGLVGLAVANGCSLSQPLHITDQLEMLTLMGHNVVLNNAQGRVKPSILNCVTSLLPYIVPINLSSTLVANRVTKTHNRGEPLPSETVDFKPDVILAADCVYYEPAFPLLLQTLKDLLALCPSATIYFCFMKRRRADMQFLKNAKKAFVVTEIPDDERPVFSRQGLFLYTFTSKKKNQAPSS